MTTYALSATLRPTAAKVDYRKPSPYRVAGIGIALIGLVVATVALIANLVVAGDGPAGADTLAWSFGINTTAFAIIKIGIAVTLIGILVRLWLRVDSVKDALVRLKPATPDVEERYGEVNTTYGTATVTPTAPAPLLIHKIAERAWTPALAMGAMLVVVGLVISFVQAGETSAATFTDLGAWVQGVQFLGEAMVLGGISFLLGTILSSLRNGGAEVQESLGVSVKTLKMPTSAKAFIALMAIGMMVAVFQLGGYIVATTVDNPVSWFAWLGPVREFALGLILAGIVLALYTIGTVLGFQFDRLRSIVTDGR
jgi:hypothetical protein